MKLQLKEIWEVSKFALKISFIAGVIFIIASTVSNARADVGKTKTIVVGTSVGDFAALVNEGLKPYLEKKGYQIKLVQFTDYVRPNLALEEGALDVNIFQHKPYLDAFTKEKGLHLSVLVPVPTAPLGLYSGKLKKLTEVKAGVSIAVPNDSTNLARALVILKELGWIELNPKSDPLRVSTKDIIQNLKGVKIIPLEAAQIPRALSDVDYAIINGNYATNAGIALSSALTREKNDNYINYAVVRSGDLNSAFAKDFADAAKSGFFKEFSKKRFQGYKFPSDWK